MENASKALLIAAGVLIVILLIAFGMSIFNSTGDTSADAETVGGAIKSETSDAKAYAILPFIDITDFEEFKQYLTDNYIGNNISADKVRVLIKLLAKRQMQVNGKEEPTASNCIHIYSGYTSPSIYWDGNLEETLKQVDNNKKYTVNMTILMRT